MFRFKKNLFCLKISLLIFLGFFLISNINIIAMEVTNINSAGNSQENPIRSISNHNPNTVTTIIKLFKKITHYQNIENKQLISHIETFNLRTGKLANVTYYYSDVKNKKDYKEVFDIKTGDMIKKIKYDHKTGLISDTNRLRLIHYL